MNRLIASLLLGSCFVPAASTAAAQASEPVRRFAPAPALPAAALAPPAREEGDAADVLTGAAIGALAGFGMSYVGLALAGACFDCHPLVGPALLLPLVVMPALGAHEGGRAGRLWVTLAASVGAVGVSALLVRDDPPVGLTGWLPFLAFQVSATTLAEIATSPRTRPVRAGRL